MNNMIGRSILTYMYAYQVRARNICAISLVFILNWARPASAATPILDVMFSKMSAERQEVMREMVDIFMVPAQRNIVDEASSVLERELQGKDAKAAISRLKADYQIRIREAGTRTSGEPRGYTAGYRLQRDRIFCFIGDENISTTMEWDEFGSRRGRVMVHEIAHAVYKAVLSEAEHNELTRLWIEYSKKNPNRTYVYAEGDEEEGFAELVEVWFGVHQSAPKMKGLDTSMSFAHLAPLMGFVEKIFGPSRNAIN